MAQWPHLQHSRQQTGAISIPGGFFTVIIATSIAFWIAFSALPTRR